MIPFLERAFKNIKKGDLVAELIDFGGCLNIRSTRGGTNWSAHSWALAIDVNVDQNPQHATPKMSKELVACFTDAGFGWGGNFSKAYIDGHHFTLAGFEWPKNQAKPK